MHLLSRFQKVTTLSHGSQPFGGILQHPPASLMGAEDDNVFSGSTCDVSSGEHSSQTPSDATSIMQTLQSINWQHNITYSKCISCEGLTI